MRDIGGLVDVATGRKRAEVVFKDAFVANVFTEQIVRSDVAVSGGYIAGVGQYCGEREIDCSGKFLVPGFIDSHVHVESSMVTPPALAEAVVKSGTTTLIADPHEIVNVAGSEGMRYFLNATQDIAVDVYFMLPSSVPATAFETGGSAFTAGDMREFANHPRVLGLGEVMCYPDVIAAREVILEKLELFEALGKPADGHSPSLSGRELQAYVAAGVVTDHECTTFAEAAEKVGAGMYVLVREGSAAKNLDALVSGLLHSGMPTDRFSFCTDDKHLDDIERDGHICHNVRKAISLGMKPMTAIKMATINSARAYNLKGIGAVCAGYKADFVLLDDLEALSVNSVYKGGVLASERALQTVPIPIPNCLLNSVHCREISEADIELRVNGKTDVIGMVPHQIATLRLCEQVGQKDGAFVPCEKYSKLVVCERHGKNGNIAVAPLKGYGIKKGAIATSVAHDSHNIIAAGDNDADIALAINTLREMGGGYALCGGGAVLDKLPLRVAGIMSDKCPREVQEKTTQILQKAGQMGIPEHVDPFISLSFMALPVIPEIRLTDKGLFDVATFRLI